MDVVVKDDDPHHDTQTEGNRFITAEAAAVLSASKQHQRISKSLYIYLPISSGLNCKLYSVRQQIRENDRLTGFPT